MTGGGFGHETADAAADVAAAARARSAARTASSAATDSRPETSPQPAQISEPTEPSPLEARYRRLLRILPRAYRRVREEEMVTTFLAAERAADPENWDLAQKFDGPDRAEKRSMVALALRLRWGRSVAPERYGARLDAVRIDPDGTNGVEATCWALAHHVTSVPLTRVQATDSRVTGGQLSSIRQRIAVALGIG